MKQVLALAISALLSLPSYAQVKVYKSNSLYSSDIICTVHDGKVFRKSSVYTTDIICRIKGTKIYNGISSILPT